MRNIILILGTVVSGIFGYVVFKATGICSACESTWLQYVVGLIFIFSYISIFRRAAHDREKGKVSAEAVVEEQEVYANSPALDTVRG